MTASMPAHERALLTLFEHKPGTLGLLLDEGGKSVGAWHLVHFDAQDQSGYAYTTLDGQLYDWVGAETTNPLTWLYGEKAPAWESAPVPVFEVTANGLVTLGGTGKDIAATLHTAGPGRYFFFFDAPDNPTLVTYTQAGEWVGNGCGPSIDFEGPYPSTDPDLLAEIVDEFGYDTPFFEASFPRHADGWYHPSQLPLLRVRSAQPVAFIPAD